LGFTAGVVVEVDDTDLDAAVLEVDAAGGWEVDAAEDDAGSV
jgi:hypothetical protein